MKKVLLTALGLTSGLLILDSTYSKAATIKNKEKVNLSIETIKSWDRWKNFNYEESLGKSKGLYTAKYKYKLNNGKTYYSLYRSGKWQGYTNIGAFKEINWNNTKDYLAYATVDFTTFGNKELNAKKTKIKKQSIPLIVKGYYLINGKKYVSLYSTTDVWLGYTEEKNVSKPQWVNTKNKTVIVKYDTKLYKSMIHICQDKNAQKLIKNKEVVIKGQYNLGGEGSTVLSLYDKEDKWIGYVWGDTFRYKYPINEDNKTESNTSESEVEQKPSTPEQSVEEGTHLHTLEHDNMYKARSVLTIAKEIYNNPNLQLENTYSFNQFEKNMFELDRMVQKADNYWGGQKADFTNEELTEVVDIVEKNMKKLVLTPTMMEETLNEYKGSNEELKKKAQEFIDKQDMRLPQHWREYYSTVKQLKENK